LPSITEITVSQLSRLIGLPYSPTIIDVRRDEDFAADPRLIPGSQRRDFSTVASWGADHKNPSVIVVCQEGLQLSQGVGAWMRAQGIDAQTVEGGFGGATGLAGILPMIWTGLRGWSRDEQRAVFQPTAVATFLMTILALGGVDAIAPDTMRLFLIGLPPLVVGSTLGWLLYGKLDEVAFREIVLALILVSGAALIAAGW
jgi:rhodanese-related sulfurtransferase